MRLRTTRTYAILDVAPATYSDIRTRLIAAGYGHAIQNGGEIDCDGIAIAAETVSEDDAPQAEAEEERLP